MGTVFTHCSVLHKHKAAPGMAFSIQRQIAMGLHMNSALRLGMLTRPRMSKVLGSTISTKEERKEEETELQGRKGKKGRKEDEREEKRKKEEGGRILIILYFTPFVFAKSFSHHHTKTVYFWPFHRNDVISIHHGRKVMREIFPLVCFIRL